MNEQSAAPVISEGGQRAVIDAWNLKGAAPSAQFSFSLLKHSENHTYLITQSGDDKAERFILRLTPQDHRTRKAIQAELEYTFHISLASRSLDALRVCRPIPLASTAEGEQQFIALVTPYADGKEFFAVLFEHAKGRGVMDEWRGLTDYTIVAAWGKALGEMHKAIASKATSADEAERHSWERMLKDIPNWNQTHGGATDIEKIKTRADAGHETSRLLVQFWNQHVEPFLTLCGERHPSVFGPIHSDLNPSNFFAEDIEGCDRKRVWVFDFDQVHLNWFGFDIGVLAHMVKFFEDGGIGKPIEGFSGEKFTEVFMKAYQEAYPPLLEMGHLQPNMLNGFQMYREFSQTSIAVDILFQSEKGKQFEPFIVSFCQTLVDRFTKHHKE